MSETTEHPAPEPEREPASTPAPESTPAPGAEPAEQTPEEEAEHKSRGDRRFAAVTAKLSAAERVQAQQAAELAYWRSQAPQLRQQSGEETPEQQQHRLRAEVRSEVETQIRTESFHAQGAAEFNDWKERCDELVQMGADANFAQLLVKMPDGVKVAGALAADPAAVARIAGMRDPDARAVALGKYAATLGNGTARTVAPVPSTRAPAPVRPVTGRAAPVFNEYTATPEQLADYYLKSDLEKARARRH
jgi:hypothetical protein